MSTLLLSETWETGYVRWRRTRPRDRLRCRLAARQLDLALAAGACPDGSGVLSLRAHSLIGMRTRGTLARSLLRAVRDAELDDRRFGPVVPVCRAGVLRCRPLLEDLSLRLTQPGPVDARGVALIRLLVSDGASPLYSALDDGALDRWVQAASDALAVTDI